ncbi:MAG: hypothetical protein J0I44_10820, partial [Microbacterium sp.]|nr:hypothetical protein [Microbacterium sp.]
MSSTPARRHSPAVYRRRRLVLLVALIAVVALVGLLIAQPWRGGGTEPVVAASRSTDPATSIPAPSSSHTSPPTPTKKATPSATPTRTGTPSPGATTATKPCATSDIVVAAVADKTSYGAGQNPKL